MPKPVNRVSDVRPKQAVIAASIEHADCIEMTSDFSLLRLEHDCDEALDTMRLAEDHWRPVLKAQFPGRGFA